MRKKSRKVDKAKDEKEANSLDNKNTTKKEKKANDTKAKMH